jgi:YHS domain-containing protein
VGILLVVRSLIVFIMASESGKKFHPWLIALPLIVVCVVLVSWNSDGSSRSNGQKSTSLSERKSMGGSVGEDDDTCDCDMLYNCTIAGNPLLGGVDFVQYFTTFKLPDGSYNETETGLVGDSSISSVVGDYVTYFLSEDNKALFDADPDAYLPQWGGYCSWGISEEFCPDFPWSESCLGPPGVWDAWTIYDGKLYFFYGSGPKESFMTDPTSRIASGNARWSEWFPTDPTENMNTECHWPKDVKPIFAEFDERVESMVHDALGL